MSNVELSFESGETSLSVRRFDVREGMSACFRATMIAMSPDDDLDLDALVGRRASITIEGPSRTGRRVLRGVCLSAEQVQAEEAGLSTYEIEIGPTLALLDYRSRSRVFQHRSIPEIIEAVFGEWGITTELAIDRQHYPRLEYKVQHAESDLAFVSRLLEEAGISFTFPTDKANDAPEMLLDDAPHQREPFLVAQHVEHVMAGARTPYVTRVRVGRKLRTGRVVIRDQHFRLRADAKLYGDAAAKDAARFERYEYAHGASVAEVGAAPADTPVADAGGASRPDPKRLEQMAMMTLARERSRRREVSFETNIESLRPGLCVRVAGHPREELRRGALLITELRTTGTINTEAWKYEARALFTDLPYRPRLTTPRPRAQGVQTATVVGPAGEDIHTDEFGRVLVQFAWDRENDFNEKSSCWLRVSQGWAGGGHASFALPRVGDEVVVGFFDADPDQPVVIGRLHNTTSPVPYRLPQAKTITTWRSASVPATGGFNEIKFEDAAGGEVVSVQAERDMRTLVKNTDMVKVGMSRRTEVGTTDDATVGERHSITIASPDASEGASVTRIEATPSKIVLSTGEARLVMEGPNVTFDVPGMFVVKAGGLVRVESAGSDVVVQGGPYVRINPRGAGEHPDAPGGAIPFELPDGKGAESFDDFMTNVALRSWFTPNNPMYLDQATLPGGELDPTPRGEKDDELRAFKYAVAGRCIGLPEGVLVRRAGALNLAVRGPGAGKGDPGNGVFGGEAPHGNSERQLAAMKKGFAFYDKEYAEAE